MMNSKRLLFLIIKKIFEWRQTSQLASQRELRRKHLIKAFILWRMLKQREDNATNRRYWVHPIFTVERRLAQGASNNLIRELEVDKEKYFDFLRMTPIIFNDLLALVGPAITKEFYIRDPIPADTRLHLCLRYLASGDSMPTTSYSFRVGLTSVSKIVSETCEVIWQVLSPIVFPLITDEMWLQKSQEFKRIWNFPHCIGAIDGRHMEITAPPHSGSTYYNYKKTHSIVLMAIADANACFTWVDVGAEGRRSDGGIFATSDVGSALASGNCNLPEPRPIKTDGRNIPYYLIGDEAFALTPYMMRPFPKAHTTAIPEKVFNYRLSRARRIVECSFGILTARWRIFRKPMSVNVDNAKKIVRAAACLHNFLMQKDLEMPAESRRYYTGEISVEDEQINRNQLSTEILSDEFEIGDVDAPNAIKIREDLRDYFNSDDVLSNQQARALNNDY